MLSIIIVISTLAGIKIEMKIPFNGSLIMHATCVDVNGSGVLIIGRQGQESLV